MALFEGSRYSYVGLYRREGIPTIRMRYLDRSYPPNSQYYTIVEGDTIDYLAYRFYGDSQYWWLLVDVNPELGNYLFDDLPKGMLIVVPPLQEKLRQLEEA